MESTSIYNNYSHGSCRVDKVGSWACALFKGDHNPQNIKVQGVHIGENKNTAISQALTVELRHGGVVDFRRNRQISDTALEKIVSSSDSMGFGAKVKNGVLFISITNY
jgi:hypothetical protein